MNTTTPRWVKSSFSFANGDCVEVAWVKSTLSETGNCVEVGAQADGHVLVRHSKDPDGPVLEFTPSEWQAFLAGVKNGEFG